MKKSEAIRQTLIQWQTVYSHFLAMKNGMGLGGDCVLCEFMASEDPQVCEICPARDICVGPASPLPRFRPLVRNMSALLTEGIGLIEQHLHEAEEEEAKAT